MTREEMINDIIRMLQDLEIIGLKKTSIEKRMKQYIHIGAGLTVCFFIVRPNFGRTNQLYEFRTVVRGRETRHT